MNLGEEFKHDALKEADERRELKALRFVLAAAQKDNHDLRVALDLLTQLNGVVSEPPRWLSPKATSSKNHATVSLLLTDTHFDEVVRPEQVDFLNAYNREIAVLRLKRVFEKTISLSRDYLSGVTYDGMVLFMGGDMFSGNIHDELKQTNVSTLFDALVYWIEHMEAGIRMMVDQFGKVHCVGVVGNHGRQTKKPIAKYRAQDNIDWLLYKLLARDFAKDPRVTFQIPEGSDAIVKIHNTTYLLTHGDQFRGGSGIAGALSPLMLGTYRKARRQSSAKKPYDVMLIGHWHQHLGLVSRGLIVGGSLKGFDEYAFQGNFEPDPRRPDSASQAFFLTTPEYGTTFLDALYVSDRVAEKW
jgi:hypothetical protein